MQVIVMEFSIKHKLLIVLKCLGPLSGKKNVSKVKNRKSMFCLDNNDLYICLSRRPELVAGGVFPPFQTNLLEMTSHPLLPAQHIHNAE